MSLKLYKKYPSKNTNNLNISKISLKETMISYHKDEIYSRDISPAPFPVLVWIQPSLKNF